mmetsp:Transcript_85585/g.266122  ORF Transcript_85585/g.266122 Transcript_85585/m.266122 type:complete len:350 (-) Transcript_85585:408-1457(-)
MCLASPSRRRLSRAATRSMRCWWRALRRCSSAISARTLASTASRTLSVRSFSSSASDFSSSLPLSFFAALPLALGILSCTASLGLANLPLVFTFLGRDRFSTYEATASLSCSCAAFRCSVLLSCSLKMGWRSECKTLRNSWFRSFTILSWRWLSAFTARVFFRASASLRATRVSRTLQTASRFACSSVRRSASSASARALAASSASFFSCASFALAAFSASRTLQRSRSARYSSSSCSSVRCSLIMTDLRRSLSFCSILTTSSCSFLSRSSLDRTLCLRSWAIISSTSIFLRASSSLTRVMCWRNRSFVAARFRSIFSARLMSSMSICSRSRCLSFRSMRPVGILRCVS